MTARRVPESLIKRINRVTDDASSEADWEPLAWKPRELEIEVAKLVAVWRFDGELDLAFAAFEKLCAKRAKEALRQRDFRWTLRAQKLSAE